MWAEEASEVPVASKWALNSGDDGYVEWAASQFDSYEIEFGVGAANERVQTVVSALEGAGAGSVAARLVGKYSINHAFHCYRSGRQDLVQRAVVRAIRAQPRYLANRGVLSILLRSTLKVRGITPLAS